ncbi:hypothetical protein F5888DRAFT_1635283 [Russula emetica]|nr:hypothetical protein F5888DRAFT_1635283 [Russula emetica]
MAPVSPQHASSFFHPCLLVMARPSTALGSTFLLLRQEDAAGWPKSSSFFHKMESFIPAIPVESNESPTGRLKAGCWKVSGDVTFSGDMKKLGQVEGLQPVKEQRHCFMYWIQIDLKQSLTVYQQLPAQSQIGKRMVTSSLRRVRNSEKG